MMSRRSKKLKKVGWSTGKEKVSKLQPSHNGTVPSRIRIEGEKERKKERKKEGLPPTSRMVIHFHPLAFIDSVKRLR